MRLNLFPVIPAKAGISCMYLSFWIPAYAGMAIRCEK